MGTLSQHRLLVQHLDMERKTLMDLLATARTRELPELVERYEAMRRELARVRLATRRSHTAEDSAN